MRAWHLREYTSPLAGCDVASNLAHLYIRQQRFSEAREYLAIHQHLLERLDPADRLVARCQGQNHYFRGQVHLGQDDYAAAEAAFKQTLVIGRQIGWQRLIVYTQNWLADTAIAQGRFDEAESLLNAGFPEAERNKDYRRIALFRRSFARLFQMRGENELESAIVWAQQALNGFERLRMDTEADEMRLLIDECEADGTSR
jgi:tetratricopeptide (TPR) repeat protein